jgi:mycobactin peptide synthetase MbtE
MHRLLLHNAFEKCVEQTPGKIALSEKNRDISYLLLNRQANYLAHLLETTGAGNNEPVAFLGVAGIDMAVAVLGIFKAGSIYMPVDVTLPDSKMKNILQQSGCRYLITTRSHRQLMLKWCREEEFPLEYLLTLTPDYLETGVIKKENGEWHTVKLPNTKSTTNPQSGTGPYHPCYQFYTQGLGNDTNILQGYHKELKQLVNWEIDALQLGNETRSGSLSCISEESSLRDMLVPLTTGGTVFIAGEDIRNRVALIIDWIRQTKVQLLHLTTPVFYEVYKEIIISYTAMKESVFPGLQYVLLSGNPLPQKIMDTWQDIVGVQAEIIHMYETPATSIAGTAVLKAI